MMRPQQAGEADTREDTRGAPEFYEYWNSMDFVSWMGARIVKAPTVTRRSISSRVNIIAARASVGER